MNHKLLVVLTRMSADPKHLGEGDTKDEFRTEWCGDAEPGRPDARPEAVRLGRDRGFLLFSGDRSGDDVRVLVLHGHQMKDAERAAKVRELAAAAVAKTGLGDRLKEFQVGVAIHPSHTWSEGQRTACTEALISGLGIRPEAARFISEYGHVSPLWTHLAPVCRREGAGPGVARAVDEVWGAFVGDFTRLQRRAGDVRHRLVHLLNPVDLDLQGWIESGFDAAYAAEIREAYPDEKLLEKVRACFHGAADSFQAVMDEVGARLAADSPLRQRLDACWERVCRLVPKKDDPRPPEPEPGKLLDPFVQLYCDARAVLAELHLNDKKDEKGLQFLTGLLRPRNRFNEWLRELEWALNKLLQTLSGLRPPAAGPGS